MTCRIFQIDGTCDRLRTATRRRALRLLRPKERARRVTFLRRRKALQPQLCDDARRRGRTIARSIRETWSWLYDRAEHLEWAKKRALMYCERGMLQLALDSLISDRTKHPETHDSRLGGVNPR